MRKLFHTLFTLTLVLIFSQTRAQVTLSPIDPGPYTPGSTIAATFTLGTDCIPTTNTFELYLSDATGSFASPTLIGSYSGFYSTFVNGVIPAGTPPGLLYRVGIKPTYTGIFSPPSNTFAIGLPAGAVTAKVNAPAISAANPETFGYCANRTNAPIFITNQSTATGIVTATITNELDGGTPTVINFDAPIKQFTPGAAHYTMLVKVVMPNGSIGTKAYFIINNLVNTAFSTSGAGLVCLPVGELSYGVDYQTPGGIQRNFPGDTYLINWGDGSSKNYTLCELKQSTTVTHNYTQSSCGSTFNGKFNVFGINISTQSPFCGAVGQPLSTSAKVVTVTENKFTGPVTGCTNTPITFTNTSIPGQNQDDGTAECTDNNVTYNWYVDGQIVLTNVPKTTNFVYTFPTAKTYEVKLESVSNGTCQGVPFIKNICIQDPPVPAFTLASNLICLTTGTVTANSSTSVLNNTCGTTPVYTWTVMPSAGVTFVQGSPNPQFRFSQTGIYNITLTLQTVASTPASCEVTTASQRVVVNGEPQATLSPTKNLCVKGDYIFDPNAIDTKTVISGNAEDLTGTYTWAVTGGTATFVAPTTANSKYPTINFADFGIYTVTLTYTNNCNTITRTQQITFTEAPVPTITVPAQICYGATIPVQGAITNRAGTTFVWSSTGGGTFTPASGDLTTVYTPTQAEQDAGTTTIRLLVSTGLQGNCAQVAAVPQTVIILPKNTGTDAVANICTGGTTAYNPVSTTAGSTFTWTAANADGNATGFNLTGTGPVNETITSTNATTNAVVVYTITPTAPGGCVGVPFTLTVNVAPKPVISTTVTNKIICSTNSAAITVTSNIPTAFVATSSATPGITGNTPTLIFGPSTSFSIADVLINPTTTQGTVTYTITPTTAAGCPGDPITVIVHVDPAVTVADAGPEESICNTTTYTLNGNLPTVGTGTWTFIPAAGQTGVTVNPTTPRNADVSGLQRGQSYIFRWTISAPGACASSQDEVVITVNTPTIPGTTGTTNPALVCSGTNTGTITLSDNTGSVLNWQSSIDGGITWTDIPNTTNTLNYTNITVSTQYRAVVKNGGCTTEFSTATSIIVTPATTIAQAGPDQTLCAGTTVTLTALSTLQPGENGIWTQTSGPATVNIPNPSNPTVNVTGLVPGQNYTFTWTITGNSPCGPTHDDVVITDDLPLANTISTTSTVVCYNQVIAITGSTPTGGNGTYSYVWEVSTDGGTNWNLIPGQTGKDLSYQLQTTSFFRRTVTSSICPLVSNVIQIIAQLPITNNTIAAGQSICTGTVPDPLTGDTPAGSDGNFNYQWQFSEDNGATWTNVNGAVALNYAPLALTTTTMYRRLVSTVACNGALQSISNAITIIVRPNAKAEYTFAADKGCTPFVIGANIITAVAYPDRNATYSWYADNVLIGTGITFPGYTIAATDQSVTIKLVTAPSQGCQPDEFSHVFSTNQSVAASYTQSVTQGCGPLIVNFVNTSTSLTNATFTWDFGNGVTSSQTMPAPVTFQPDPTGRDRTYTVTLTATTSCGSTSVTSTVFVKAKPISVFSPSRTVGCSPMLVTFSNTSPGETNTYSYDFGDGSPLVTTTDKSSVQHTYLTNVVKNFVVTMTAQNECGSDQSSYTINVSPNTVTAELVVNADQKVGCAPFTVNFYNNSRGASSFIYDFGDGSTLVTRSAPEVVNHTFTTAGTYNVTLTASNGCSEITTSESITVLPQPLAQFNAANTLGCPGLVVQFNNTSTGGISYLWDFGDGTTSQETAPQHVYAGTQEFYTVSLTATNSLGCTYTTTLNQYIHIVQPPVAQFNVLPSTLISIPNYTFRFEDESTNTPTIWLWDFGDHTASALKNPSHTYQDVGTYTVTLKVTNQQGCFTTTFKEVTIAGVPGYLYVPNSFMPGSATSELRVFGAKGSGIKAWTMTIFNKWGQQLWLTNKLDEGRPVESWDGTFNSVPVPQGVYFWKIDVEFINGSAWKGMTYDSSAPKKTGVIHLLR